MPWVKFSDDWYDDPELIEAGPAAMLVWPLLISWSARNLTDGKIPAGQVRRLVDWHSLGIEPEQTIAPLVSVGRLQEIAGGYLITNFLKYQPSREKVLADREASKVRAAKSRSKSGGRTPKSDDGAVDVRDSCADSAQAPVPVPVPDDPSSSSTGSALLPAGLWMKIAEKQAQATTSRIVDPSAWKRKAAKNAEADMTERAVALVENYDLDTSKLVDVLLSAGNPPWLAHYRRPQSA